MTSSGFDVFLNVPYDRQYEQLLLALISGLCAFGLTPRATLELPSGERRLDKIYALMTSCRYSIHDLSRVELDSRRPPTPRFNMPFELGLLLGWQQHRFTKASHTWFVLESRPYRLSKSLSDLNGTDPLLHGGTAAGVLRILGNAFFKEQFQPSYKQMAAIYANVRLKTPILLRREGCASLFEPKMFRNLAVLASQSAEQILRLD